MTQTWWTICMSRYALPCVCQWGRHIFCLVVIKRFWGVPIKLRNGGLYSITYAYTCKHFGGGCFFVRRAGCKKEGEKLKITFGVKKGRRSPPTGVLFFPLLFYFVNLLDCMFLCDRTILGCFFFLFPFQLCAGVQKGVTFEQALSALPTCRSAIVAPTFVASIFSPFFRPWLLAGKPGPTSLASPLLFHIWQF